MIQFFSKNDLANKPVATLLVNSKVKELNTLYKNKRCDCHPDFQWTVSVELTKGNYTIAEVIPEEIQPCTFLKEILNNEIIPRLNAVTA